jgi:uncharacterized protein
MGRRIVLTGATGLIGRHLYRELYGRGDAVTVLARNPERAVRMFPDAALVQLWAPGVAGAWRQSLDGADAVIHLAGEPLDGERWSDPYKRRLRESRIIGTREITDAALAAKQPPSLFLSASAVGYYGDTGDTSVVEDTPAGTDFLAALCADWESEARRVIATGARLVILRNGVVLAGDGGALKKLLTPFRMFAGGPVGSGAQWMSWIHIADTVGIILHALDRADFSGTVNAVSPEPVRNRDFAVALGRALRRPAGLQVPSFLLRLAVGEMSDVLLGGQRVLPRRVLDSGYTFRHPDLAAALRDLLLG